MKSENELTDPDYWDKNWESAALPRVVQPWKNPLEGRLARFFRKHLPRGGRCLEIGCAASPWLPFFARELGYEPWGVDYSALGLKLAQANMEMQKIPCRFVFGDFTAVEIPISSFRMIFSSGVVEHYADPGAIFNKAFDLLEPGGLIVTIIPNIVGFLGMVLKRMNRPIWDVHVPFGPEDMDRLHKKAGFDTILPSHYFGVFGLGILAWHNVYGRIPKWVRRPLAYTIQYSERLVGWATWWGDGLLDNRHSSPYIIGIYKKPASSPITS